MLINEIIKLININPNEIIQFKDFEDGNSYNVWKIITNDKTYVLKEVKNKEIDVYSNLLKNSFNVVPKLYKIIEYQDKKYILIEYIDGKELLRLNLNVLIKTIDSLIKLQESYWDNKEYINIGYNYEESLISRINRGKYLNNELLEKHYNIFLNIYSNIPKTLCHDDLLPFNVIVNNERTVILDWEYAGILPYMTSFARLIAHTGNNGEFFYALPEDINKAINYYYQSLICNYNITYGEYMKTLNYFTLYEYSEWIMLQNKYHSVDSDRYNMYLNKAIKLAEYLDIENK